MIQVAYVVCRGFFAGRLVYLEQALHDIRIILRTLLWQHFMGYNSVS